MNIGTHGERGKQELEFGSLTVRTDTKTGAPDAQGSNTGGGIVGIMVEPRKRDARILYLDPCRSLWLTRSNLRPAFESEVKSNPLKLVADLIAWLRGKGLEIEHRPGGALRISIHHGAITPDQIDSIREKIGIGLQAWRLRPAGLKKIQSVFEILPCDLDKT